MELIDSIEALSALAHPGRMGVFRLLVRRYPDGVQPSEIAACLQMPRNTLSAHLSVMKHAGLVTAEREGRAIFCRVNIAAVGDLMRYLTADCCRGRPDLCEPLQLGEAAVPAGRHRPLNVLFVCTGNSARSIFAEAILTHKGGAAFRAFSGGTQPRPAADPRAIDLLRRLRHPVDGLHPKHVDVFRAENAPRMDFVFTVCDRAANEDCPPWPSAALTAHWGLPDPVDPEGAEDRNAARFRKAYDLVEEHVTAFLALPLRSLDRRALQQRLDDIGRC